MSARMDKIASNAAARELMADNKEQQAKIKAAMMGLSPKSPKYWKGKAELAKLRAAHAELNPVKRKKKSGKGGFFG